MKSDTPRMDKAMQEDSGNGVRLAIEGCKLERELNAANKDLSELKKRYDQLVEAAEFAWTVICNVDDGEHRQSDKWKSASVKCGSDLKEFILKEGQ